MAKARFAMWMSSALRAYVKAHDGQLPSDSRELLPFFKDDTNFTASQVGADMLQRYAVVYSGALKDVPAEKRNATLIEINSIDEDDQRVYAGPNGFRLGFFRELREETGHALWLFTRAKSGSMPSNAEELLPYFDPPLSAEQRAKFLQNAGTLLSH
jgi:hypothetical protein